MIGVNAITGTYLTSGSDGCEEMSVVKLSADGRKLCVPSHDNHK